MKFRFATQVFSHSVAVAMHTYIEFNALPKQAIHTAPNSFQKWLHFFDLLNSSNLQSFQAFMATESITCNGQSFLKISNFGISVEKLLLKR